MKSFKLWLATSTSEVQQLPVMGQKLAYALYKRRHQDEIARNKAITIEPEELHISMLGFAE